MDCRMTIHSPSQHISLSRVAELAGASPQSVSNWRKRFEDFPQPVAGTDRRPLFDRDEMVGWLQSTGRLNDNPGFATRLWAFMDGLRVSLPPSVALQVTLSAVAWKTLSERPVPAGFTGAGKQTVLPEGLQVPAEDLGPGELDEQLDGLVRWAESNLIGAYGAVFDPLKDAVAQAGERFLSILLRAVVTAPEDGAELEAALDEMLSKAGSQDILGRTSAHLRELSLAVLDIKDGDTVLDAACGSGSFLLHVAGTHAGTECIGAELDEGQLRLAATAALISGTPVELRAGNSMTADPAEDVIAEKVFIDPPFGLRIRDAKVIQGDPRWVFGVPTLTYDFAWLQHALAHLAANGRAVVILPIGDLASGAGRNIRSELLRYGAIEAVIALPRGTYPGMSTAPTLWSLRKPDAPGGTPGAGVLLIDASDQDVSDPGALQWVAGTVAEYRQGHDLSTRRPRAAVVSVLDLLSEEANLAPSRWLAETFSADQASVDASIRNVREAVDRLAGFPVPGPLSVVDAPVPFIKLQDLAAAKSLKIFKDRAIPADALTDTGTVPVLSPATLAGNTAGQKYADDRATEIRSRLTQPGDLAVWMGPEGLAATVLAEGGGVAGPHIQLVRILDGSFNPDYLAACLASSHNARFLQGTAVLRPNLGNLEVPSLTIAEQHKIGQELRNLAALRAQAAEASARIAQLSTLVSDTIGEGALRL
jgi:SAM-dependent methyltransferase